MDILQMLKSDDEEMRSLGIITLLSLPDYYDFVSKNFIKSKYSGAYYFRISRIYHVFGKDLYTKDDYCMYIIGECLYFHKADAIPHRIEHNNKLRKIDL